MIQSRLKLCDPVGCPDGYACIQRRMRGRTSGIVKDQLGGRLLNVNLADSIQLIRLTSS